MERDKLISLVTKAQQGDQDALNDLFNAFYNDVYYFALKTVKDDQIACDITQETFVEIINTLGNLQEPAAFVKWMKQIAYHQCTRYFKKKKDVIVDEDEDGNTIFDTLQEDKAEFIPEEALDKDDFKKTIMSMIDDLSEEQRAALMMFYYDELSIKQIAEIQGTNENTVKSRLNYAKKGIKKSVEDYEKKNGVKLHCVGVLPLLLWLFKDYFAQSVPASATVVAEGVAGATGTAVAITATTTTTVATTATTTAAVGIGAKIASLPIATKVIAGIVVATIAIGGTVAVVSNRDTGAPEDTSSIVSDDNSSSDNSITDNTYQDSNASYAIPQDAIYITADGKTYISGETITFAPSAKDQLITEEYIYYYNYLPQHSDYGVVIEQEYVTDLGGWCVRVQDNTKSAYTSILPTINGAPIVSLEHTYMNCSNLIVTPEIPNTVTNLYGAFMNCSSLTTVTNFPTSLKKMDFAFSSCSSLVSLPQFPNGVQSMVAAFQCCYSLQSVPAIPESVNNLSGTFMDCKALTGTIAIDAQLHDTVNCGGSCPRCSASNISDCNTCCYCSSTDGCFATTEQNIIITGKCNKLDTLTKTATNENVFLNKF